MEYVTIIKGKPQTADDIIRLYSSVGWGNQETYSKKKIMTMVLNTDVFYCAYILKNVVGFARLCTDDSYCTYLIEVIIDPKFQKMGIGTKILNSINNDYGHTTIYLDAIVGQEAFFEKNKYKKAKNLVTMYKKASKTLN